MRRRWLSVLLSAAICATLFAGCAGGADKKNKQENTGKTEAAESTKGSAGSQTTVGKSDAKTVLKWAIWDAKTAKYWESVASAYVAKHADVRIEMVDLGSAQIMYIGLHGEEPLSLTDGR